RSSRAAQELEPDDFFEPLAGFLVVDREPEELELDELRRVLVLVLSRPDTCAATFLAPSATNSTTSGALSFTKSCTVSTWRCTTGAFQNWDAVALICSSRSRPARVPSTYPTPSPARKR